MRGGDLDSGTRGHPAVVPARRSAAHAVRRGRERRHASRTCSTASTTFRLWAKDRALNVDRRSRGVDVHRRRDRAAADRREAGVQLDRARHGRRDRQRRRPALRVLHGRAAARRARSRGTRCSSSSTRPGRRRAAVSLGHDGATRRRVGAARRLDRQPGAQSATCRSRSIVDNLAPSASVTAPAKIDHVLGGQRVHDRRRRRARTCRRTRSPPTRSCSSIRSRRPPCCPRLPPGATVGPAYRIHATDMTLDKPATLTFRLSTSARHGLPAAIYRIDHEAGHARSCRSADSTTTTCDDLDHDVVARRHTSCCSGRLSPPARASTACAPSIASRACSRRMAAGSTRELAISFEVGEARATARSRCSTARAGSCAR